MDAGAGGLWLYPLLTLTLNLSVISSINILDASQFNLILIMGVIILFLYNSTVHFY